MYIILPGSTGVYHEGEGGNINKTISQVRVRVETQTHVQRAHLSTEGEGGNTHIGRII
jgi:hypothetical protein